MASQIQREINKAFQVLSNEIIPSDEYLENGRKAADTIFNLLQGKSKFDVSRQYISGSSGKKTAIFDSDLDLVLFINDINLSDIEDVLDDFEDVLTLTEVPQLDAESVSKTRFSIQFRYDVFDVDVLPAINFVNHQPHQPPNPRLAAQQASAVLREIKENPRKAYHYSSGLAESQLKFMKNQSGFIHELVRICKLWNKSLLIDGRISGRSTLIELIAVNAGEQEENRPREDRSLLSAFQTFLRRIEDFPCLKIEFGFDPMKPNGSLSELKRSSWDEPALKHSYYAIEPANPFNNIAKGVDEDQMKLFQSYAKETLQRLSDYVTASHFIAQIPLDEIFQPQPTIIPFFTEAQKKFFQTASFLVQASVEKGPLCPSMVIRNEEKYKDRDMQAVLKHLQTVFLVVAQGFVSSFSSPSKSNSPGSFSSQSADVKSKSTEEIRKDLQDRISKCIDVNVQGVGPRSWSPSGGKHEDYEVTLTIPCRTQTGGKETNFCIRVSFKSQ